MKGKVSPMPRDSEISATAFVYDRLRELILRGRFAGGTLLVEQDVARALKVSRTPVHEALRLLGAEGLIEIKPRRRARVSEVGIRDIEQLYAIRGSLECLASEDAARNSGPGLIARLEQEAAVMEDVAGHVTPEGLQAFTDANKRFHHEILSAAANRWLDQALRPVLGVLLGPVSALAGPSTKKSDIRYELLSRNLVQNCRQHRRIIDALRNGDPGQARAAMQLHVDSAQREWGGAVERLRRAEQESKRLPRR